MFHSERLPKTHSRNRLDRYFNTAPDLFLRERAERSIQLGGKIVTKIPSRKYYALPILNKIDR